MNHIDFFFRLLSIDLSEDTKLYIKRKTTFLKELLELKKELKKDYERQLKEVLGEAELNNQKVLKQKKDEIVELQSAIKNLEVELKNSKDNLTIEIRKVKDLAVSIEKCNELIKNKDNKIQTQENMLKNNINVFEEQIEVKWKENNKEIIASFSNQIIELENQIGELEKQENRIIDEIDKFELEKKSLLDKITYLNNQRINLETDIAILEEKCEVFFDKFNKLFVNRAPKNSDFTNGFYTYSKDVLPNITDIVETTDLSDFAEDFSHNLEVSGINRDYTSDLAEYIIGIFSCNIKPFLMGYNTNSIAHAFSYLVSGEKAEIINVNPGFSNVSHLFDIINNSKSKVIVIENILNSVSENAYLSLLKEDVNKFVFFSLESSENVSLLPSFLKNYFFFINIDPFISIPRVQDYYFSVINEDIFKFNIDNEKTLRYCNKINKFKILNSIGNIKCSEIFTILDTGFNRDFNEILKNLVLFSIDMFDLSKYNDFYDFLDNIKPDDKFKKEIIEILGE